MKTNVFLTVLLLLAGLTSAHAEVIQIGSGSGTNTSLPTNVYYRYSVSQQIYTAEELGAAGTIKSIAFYNNGTFSSSRNLYIYFVATDVDAFYSQADWISFSSADEVFGEFVDFMPKEWTTITLQNPFQYDGKKNLAVIVTDDTGSYDEEELPFLTFESTGATLFARNDNSAYNSSTLGNNLGTKLNAKNQIKLDIDRPETIRRVDVSIDEPVWGGHPCADVTLPSNAGYTFRNIYWYNDSNLDEGYTFDKEETVAATIDLEPKAGNVFADNVEAYINGELCESFVEGGSLWVFTKYYYLTDAKGTVPTDCTHKYSITQQIFTSDDLGDAGVIESLSFPTGNFGSEPVTRNLEVYVVKTNKKSFSSGKGWIPFTVSDMVFGGELDISPNSKLTIPLAQKFYYDGEYSLAVIVRDVTGSAMTSNAPKFTASDATALTLAYTSDDAAIDNLSGLEGTVLPYRNKIEFGITPYSLLLPTCSHFNYFISQQIYQPDEVDQTNITSISLYNVGEQLTRNLDIYLVDTDKEYFQSGDSWIPFSDADMVFSGEVTFTPNVWTAIPFCRAFTHNSSKHLALIICDNTGSATEPLLRFLTKRADAQVSRYMGANVSRFYNQTINSYDYPLYTQNQKNIVLWNEADVDKRPYGIDFSDVTWNQATVTWQSEGTCWNVEYKARGADRWSYNYGRYVKALTLNRLEQATTYDVHIQIDNRDGTLSPWSVTASFTTKERYTRPSNIQLLDVSPRRAVVNWKENSGATSWEILVENDAGEEVKSITTDRKPCIITGLEQNMRYILYIRSLHPEDNDHSLWRLTSFTTPVANPAPADLAASTTPNSATISWTGKSDSYTLRYKKTGPVLTNGFEDSTLGEWTTIDANADGYGWVLGSAVGGVYLPEGYSLTDYSHNASQDLIVSGSYRNIESARTPLTPDNFLVSPKVALGGTIGFWAKGQNPTQPDERFGVAVSTTSNTDPSAFTMVSEDKTATNNWTWYSFDLSAYAGQEGYVAIRHYNCTGNWLLDVDDIAITQPAGEEDEPWTVVENATSPCTIEGLELGTGYICEVIGSALGQKDASSGILPFTTLSRNPAPFDIVVKPQTTSADVSWTGFSDAYIVRYREEALTPVFFDDFESGDLATKGWTVYTEGEALLDGGWFTEDAVSHSYYNRPVTNHSGSQVVCAPSYWHGTIYDADNWLVTPKVRLGGVLRFWQMVDGDYPDKYEVLLSTTGNAIADFTTTLREMAPGSGDWEWKEIVIDLSAYEGQEGYIAIHHKDRDANVLFIDDFGIYSKTPGPWQTSAAFATQTTLTGLKLGTMYELEISGGKSGEPDATSEVVTFMTRPVDAVDIALDANADNRTTISSNHGIYANVTIQNLTLKSGQWRTICLPFDVDVEHSLLAGADVRMATDVGEDNTTGFIILNCLTPVTQMKAHTPYVIRWNGATDIVNPVFERVIVLYGDPDTDTNGVYLYDKKVKLGANYQCFDYSGSNTSLYKMIDGSPSLAGIKTGDTLYAFDGYFWFSPEVFAEPPPSS